MKFNKSVQVIIEKRTSIRNYVEKEIDSNSLNEINKLLNSLSDDVMNFKLIDLSNKTDLKFGTYGVIKGAKTYLIGTIKKNHINNNDTIIEFGYRFEKIVLKATDLGLGTCWMGATFSKKKAMEIININKDEIIGIVSPIGYASVKSGVVDKMVRKVVKSSQRKEWEKIFFDENFSKSLSLNDNYSKALKMVRMSPSYKNIQPWRIIKNGDFYDFYSSTLIYSKNDTISYPLNDMGIAKCHFELMANELGLCGEWIKNDNYIIGDGFNYVFSWSSVNNNY